MNVKSRLGGLAVVAVAVFAPGAFERGWAQDTDYLAMLEFFSNCQAPQPFPLGSSKGVEIGDRCYLGYPGGSAIPSIAFGNGTFQVSILTTPAKTYLLEYTDSLAHMNWVFLSSIVGDGRIKLLTDPTAMVGRRFYRVHKSKGCESPSMKAEWFWGQPLNQILLKNTRFSENAEKILLDYQ